MTVKITKATARKTVAKLAEHFGIESEAFAIYGPGFHSSGWTIASEVAPYEWAIQASEVLNDGFRGPILYEPVTHWCIGLYAA